MLKSVEFAWDIPNVTFEWFKHCPTKNSKINKRGDYYLEVESNY